MHSTRNKHSFSGLHTLLLAALLVVTSISHAALPANDSQNKPLPTLAPLIKNVKPAVVNISVKATQQMASNPLLNDPFFRQFFNIPKNYQQPKRKTSSAGSGVIIDSNEGIVITNYHVIKNADEIHIGLSDKRSFEATLIGSDPDVDIAVLKIEAKDLQALPLADANKLEVGDFAIAIGNPFGLNHTVTSGIVSALERSGLGIEGYENFIQTDASINPGNSGGALINLRGELIGINTAILAPSGGNVGIGFAIPIDMAMNSTQQILDHGEVRRGKLGIYIQDLSPELSEAFNLKNDQQGVLVSNVEADSPAEKSGIKAEDIITHINGKAVSTTQELRNAVGLANINKAVSVKFLRQGKSKSVSVKLASQVELDNNKTKNSKAKLPNSLQGLELQQTPEGLLISQIKPGSPATKTGLKAGDIILEANRKRIKSIQGLHALSDQQKILLRIARQGAVFYLYIR